MEKIRRTIRIEQTIRRVVTIVEERIGPKPAPRVPRRIPVIDVTPGRRPALRVVTGKVA